MSYQTYNCPTKDVTERKESVDGFAALVDWHERWSAAAQKRHASITSFETRLSAFRSALKGDSPPVMHEVGERVYVDYSQYFIDRTLDKDSRDYGAGWQLGAAYDGDFSSSICAACL